MYSGEFNLKKVANELGLSENGLAKVEKGTTNVQAATVELAERYFSMFNVPFGFFDKEPISSMQPFYLGKQDDMLPYYDRFYEVNGQKHFLDTRSLPEIDYAEFRYYDAAIDTAQADVVEGEDGGLILNQIGVEITMNVYQVSTGQPLWEKRMNQMAVISPTELGNLEKALRRDIDVLIRQYSQMFAMQEQLKEAQLRETLLKGQVQKSLKGSSDTDSNADDQIKALIDEID